MVIDFDKTCIKEKIYLLSSVWVIDKDTGTTINRATGGYQRLDESGRLISKREMRDEVEPFDLQRGDDS
jgi:hypothetical protein